MKTEIWKPISGCDGYEVSSMGRVRSLNRTIFASDGRAWSFNGRILKQRVDKKGYCYVALDRKQQAKRPLAVHRLVATAFVPNPENKPCVNHKNLKTTDNSVGNLEWVTYSENAKHALGHGRLSHLKQLHIAIRGENSSVGVLTEGTVREIFRLKGKVNGRELARKHGINPSSVYKIWNGQSWRHLRLLDSPGST